MALSWLYFLEMCPDVIIVKNKILLAHPWNCVFSKCYNLQKAICYWNFLSTEYLKEDRFIWAGLRRMGTCGVQVGGFRIKQSESQKRCLAPCDQLWTPGAVSCCWLVFYGAVTWNTHSSKWAHFRDSRSPKLSWRQDSFISSKKLGFR